jgi:hypothetical protein
VTDKDHAGLGLHGMLKITVFAQLIFSTQISKVGCGVVRKALLVYGRKCKFFFLKNY